MRQVFRKKVLYGGVVIIILIIFLHPDKNGHRTYEYIEKDDILDNLHYGIAENFSSNAVGDCEYRDILFDDTTLSPGIKDGDLVEGHKIKEGGEYAPLECKPKFSTAIIVPYRERAEQLRSFLIYMHTFLRRQLIHYRIFVVEQVDSRPFNRAKLMNVGAVVAARAGFPCLVLHDVDLLPLRPANIYACTENPRHLSSSINSFRFVLPYLGLFGGAIAITTKQYKDINGMSNEYYGWGGEDDDLYIRLEAHGLKRCRFEPGTSRYHMLTHRKEPRSDTDFENTTISWWILSMEVSLALGEYRAARNSCPAEMRSSGSTQEQNFPKIMHTSWDYTKLDYTDLGPNEDVKLKSQTGNGGFSSYLNRFKCKDSPSCVCEPDKHETVEHLIMECPVHEFDRMRQKVNKLLNYAKDRINVDGLNTLQYTEVATVLHPLFTHIMVDL